MPFVIDKFKFKNGASVSEEFALFNGSSVGYLTYHLFKISIINIKKVILISGGGVKSFNNISLIID